MKILIATDSRGIATRHFVEKGSNRKKDFTWLRYFGKQNPNCEIVYHNTMGIIRKGVVLKGSARRLLTLYGVTSEIKKSKERYDVIVIQLGAMEWITSWSINVLQMIVADKTHKINDKFLCKTPDPELFLYKDEELVKECIEELKQRCDHLLFIGMHSWLLRAKTRHRDFSDYCYHEAILEMNDVYSRNVDFFNLPMSYDWANRNSFDYLHYRDSGHRFISDYVSRYLNRINIIITEKLKRNCTKNNFIVVNECRKSQIDFLRDSERTGYFISKLTKENDIVLISKRTSFEQLQSFIGCILFKRIPVIVQHPSPKVDLVHFENKINNIKDVCNPSLVISDECDYNTYSKFFDNVICDIKSYEYDKPNLNIKPNDIAFIQLSSGTTGTPKITEVTHGSLIEHCEEYAKKISFSDKDVVVSWLPLYHDMGLIACTLFPLMLGASFVHIHPFDWLKKPATLFEAIKKYKGTVVWMPNFAFSYVCNNVKEKVDTSSMRMFINCSEMCTNDVIKRFCKIFNISEEKFHVCYALAENVFAVSQTDKLNVTEYMNSEIVSCGTVVPGTSCIIVKDNKDVTNKDCGNIFIKSSYMSNSIKRTFYGYYDTGDVGFINNENLYIIGRSDDMIISYGENIFPYEIENISFSIDGVIPGRAACFGIPNKDNSTNDVYLIVESDIENSLELSMKIIKSVFEKLGINVVCQIKKRGWIVKTSSGKVSRNGTRNKLIEEKNGINK